VPLARAVWLLPAALALACGPFTAPAAAPEQPAPEPLAFATPLPAPPPPVPVEPTANPAELADLRALLGQTADDPGVRALSERWGAPRVTQAGSDVLHNFVDHRVLLRFAADGRVVEVALLGARDRLDAYPHALPDGLRFGMNSFEVGRALGVEIPLREVGKEDDTRVLRPAVEGGRTFRGHGLVARFDSRWRLTAVGLVPVAAPGGVYLDDALVVPGEHAGARGLRVHYQISFGAPGGCDAVDVELRLTDASGAPVRALVGTPRRDQTGFTAVDKAVPCQSSDHALFVPFSALNLVAGPQDVGVHLSVGTAGASTRDPAELVTRASFAMPTVALVRLKVSRAEVRREIFRRRNTAATLTLGISSLFSHPKARPDPFWVLVTNTLSYRSRTRSSTFSPRWSDSTGWFALSEHDTIMVYVADADLVDNERLGTFSISFEQLRAAVRDRTPLSADWVDGLHLDGTEIRLAGAAPSPGRKSR